MIPGSAGQSSSTWCEVVLVVSYRKNKMYFYSSSDKKGSGSSEDSVRTSGSVSCSRSVFRAARAT